MYCRARSFSGVPSGLEPMVPASTCTCTRAFSTENRGACRLQAPRHRRRVTEAARRIRNSLIEVGAGYYLIVMFPLKVLKLYSFEPAPIVAVKLRRLLAWSCIGASLWI